MDDSGMQASRCGLTSQFVKNLVTTIHNFGAFLSTGACS